MVLYTWILENKLAQGPMPNFSEIPEIAYMFDAVIVLVMPHEIPGNSDYYLSLLRSNGLEVLYIPTPDFHPLQLLELFYAAKFIDEIIQGGGRVFVHCMGGIGRSGLVSAAYLVYRGMDLFSAIRYVRGKVPGALDNFGQFRMLEDFYILMKNMERERLNKILGFAEKHNYGRGLKHSSKTLQLFIELSQLIDLGRDDLRAGIEASILHCISYPSEPLGLESHKLIVKEGFSKFLSNKALCILKEWESSKEILSLLIRISHNLDSTFDQRIVVSDHEYLGEEVLITLYCDLDCTSLINKALSDLELLEKVINRKIRLIQQSYMSSI
jgi:protein-tyrosine phosphatase